MPIYIRNFNLIGRAGRSVGDRYLGMVEAAGSIPARSIFQKFKYNVFFDIQLIIYEYPELQNIFNIKNSILN